MGARKKLNIAVLNGSLLIAAFVGIVFDSWFVFSVVAGVLIAGELYAGGIRPGGRSGQSRQ